MEKNLSIYVLVNFSSQIIFVFLLFLGMEMYANEVETKDKEKLPEIKNWLQHNYINLMTVNIFC